MDVLAGREDWRRVHGRMAARATGGVPAPTKWHEPENDGYYPLLSTHPFYGPSDAGWSERLAAACELLERFYPTIKEELVRLQETTKLPQYSQPKTGVTEREEAEVDGHVLLHKNGDWTVHYLMLEGADLTAQRAAAPKTAKIVQSIERQSGHAFFSVMDPGTHILPHCGPSNFRLRLHLGLVVPPNCRIRVGDQTRTWEEGKVLVVDDAFEHEVWNDSDQKRVVLVVDIWHPDFTNKEVKYMEGMRDARRRAEASTRQDTPVAALS
jgi:aspartate beta-hydroxylase